MRKLRSTLQNGREKYDGSKKKAVQVLARPTRIEECLAEVSPIYEAAWSGQMKCTTGADQADQEHKAMVETAHRLYETLSQNGEPPLTMMQGILMKMQPMDFKVTKEAAQFAAEAYIHHMCTVANLIKTCCFEGAAYDLITSLGPERFTEWKAALINQAAGKVPNLFRMLEEDVRAGRFQPYPGEGPLKYGKPTPGYDITELMDDMTRLRVVCTDLRRAELTAAKEADRVKAAARVTPEASAQQAPHGGNRRTSGADDLRSQSKGILAARPADPGPNLADGTESMVQDDELEAKAVLREGLEQAIAEHHERTLDAIVPHVADTTKPAEEQAEAKAAHRVAAARVKIDADAELVTVKKKLYKDHAHLVTPTR
jgi:hypothetical protein